MGEVLGLLRDLRNDRQLSSNVVSGTSDAAPTPKQPSSSSISTPSNHTVQPVSSDMLGAAGESSLAAHSAFASDFVHQVASAVPTQTSGPEIRDTLDALSHVVTTLREQTVASEMAYPHARPNPRPGPSRAGHELPPIKKAVELIGIAKSRQMISMAL